MPKRRNEIMEHSGSDKVKHSRTLRKESMRRMRGTVQSELDTALADIDADRLEKAIAKASSASYNLLGGAKLNAALAVLGDLRKRQESADEDSCSSSESDDVTMADDLNRFTVAIAYYIRVRSLQSMARTHRWSRHVVSLKLIQMTPASHLEFLRILVGTSRKPAYRLRRWAPFRPTDSAIISSAKDPSISYGEMVRRLLIARIFMVTSARLNTWRDPLSRDDYHRRNIKVYHPFGQHPYKKYVALFQKSLDAFDHCRFDNVRVSVGNPISMKRVNRWLGRIQNAAAWSSHLIINDVATIMGPDYVVFDKQYWKASENGKGVPADDATVEEIRLAINRYEDLLTRPLEKWEVKHTLCEVRQWGLWKHVQDDLAESVPDVTADQTHSLTLEVAAKELATYILRKV